MNKTRMRWAGLAVTGLFAAFILVASVAPKLMGADVAADTMIALGWPAEYTFMIGMIELLCLVLYLVPRTSVLGAVLMMGLLGDAMAAQFRVDNPLYSHVLFSVYLGLFMWGGLWLRNATVRSVFPFVRTESRPKNDIRSRAVSY